MKKYEYTSNLCPRLLLHPPPPGIYYLQGNRLGTSSPITKGFLRTGHLHLHLYPSSVSFRGYRTLGL